MSKSEHRIQDEIRLAISEKTPHICLRCNAGQVWAREKRFTPEYGYVIVNPRPVKLLPEGFPDLLCLGPNADTVFLEVKNDVGKIRKAQDRFIALMRNYGYPATVVRSAEEAVNFVNNKDRRRYYDNV